MMEKPIFCALICLLVAGAVVADAPCVSDQFQAHVEEADISDMVVAETLKDMYFDYTNQRMRIDVLDNWNQKVPSPWGRKYSMVVLNSTMYTVNSTTCMAFPMGKLVRTCLDEYRKMSPQEHIAGVAYDVWTLETGGYSYEVDLTPDTNILIAQKETNVVSGHREGIKIYTDFVPEIKDPSLFKKPGLCNGNLAAMDPDDASLEHVRPLVV